MKNNSYEEKEFDHKNFSKMMRRLSHCGYSSVILANRMFMNCYNIDEDETIGMHFIMFIDEPFSELYDEKCFIDYSRISNLIKLGDANVTAYKKENSLKAKDVLTRSYYYSLENVVELHIQRIDTRNSHVICDTVIELERLSLPAYQSLSDNIISAYEAMISRIDYDYPAEITNGITEQIYELAVCSVRPFYYNAILRDKTVVHIPFIKSFFRDIRKFDKFYISIRRTTISNVYLISFLFESNGITESYIMYLENLI